MTRRIKYPKRVPTMIAMALNASYEGAELAALIALRSGTATIPQFDVLIDCRNMLALGADMRKDQTVAQVADLASIAIGNIRDHVEATGEVIATEDDLHIFHVMIEVSHDFWRRQGGRTFAECHARLTAWTNSSQQTQEASA